MMAPHYIPVPYFHGIDRREFMVRPSRVFEEVSYPPGAAIFAQGEVATILYLVVQGAVECWPGALDSPHRRVTLREGMIVGEGGLLHPMPYPVSAVAGPAGCRLLHVPHTAIQPKLDRSDAMIVTVIRMLMDYTRNTNRRVVELMEEVGALEQDAATLPDELTQLRDESGGIAARQRALDVENAQLRKIVDDHIRGRAGRVV
jgi:CRP-like cAMP-binding protein